MAQKGFSMVLQRLRLFLVCTSILLGSVPVSANGQGGIENNPGLECVFPHEEPGYVSWVCDAEGKRLSEAATLHFVRTNLNGARVVLPLWTAPLHEWGARAADVIDSHRKENANCAAYFHVAHPVQGGGTQWNRVTKNMQKWWDKEGKRKFPKFCYISEPWAADYVILWSDFNHAVPYSYSVPSPQTSYVTGTTSGWVSGQYVYGQYSGTVTTTEMRTYQGSWRVWNFLLAVRPVQRGSGTSGEYLGTPLFWSDHKGRWRWSKPDKDSLIDALNFIKSQLPNKGEAK